VYPELEEDEAHARLWEAIAHVCRLDADDPEAAWRERGGTLQDVATRLTERRFDGIRLHGPGTDVTVGLMPSSVWLAADFETVDGVRHFPNVPSEEIFTTPDPARVDGHVTATRPLEVYGAMIHGIRVEFAAGRAVKIDADRGADALDTVFYETLLDENAASHIALGNAYELGVASAEDKQRLNASSVHVDFMIGSPEIDVDGITRDGDAVPVLRGGAWQI
jgi:aminopeptidase